MASSEISMKGLSIVDLPSDILCLILKELPFHSHFPLISTCKRLYAGSEYILRQHQKAHAGYGVVSDLNPTTVLSLLEIAFGNDPLPAWHIRSLEIWRDRTSWADWITYMPSAPPNSKLQAGPSDAEILKLQPSLAKVSDYLDWFDARAHEGMYGDWNHKSRALQQVETGHDGILKALLIANCPRLREVRFVPRAADKDTGSALWWLKTLISISKCTGRMMIRPLMVSGETESEEDSDEEEEEEDVEEEGESGEEQEEGHVNEGLDGEENMEEKDRNNKIEVMEAMEQCELFDEPIQDECLSETESTFNREWEAAFANWQEEQRLSEEQCTNDEEDEHICGAECRPDNSVSVHKSTPAPKRTLPECPGLISLHSVAIGVISNTWMDDIRYPCSLRLLGRLLKLPNLDTLYFNGLRCDGSEHFHENADNTSREDSMVSVLDYDCIEANSSSVKHLVLEGLDSDLSSDVREMLFRAPRELQTAAFRHRGPRDEQANTAALVRDLALTQSSSLQNLMFYNYESETTGYEKCTLFRLYDFYGKFSTLKQLTFNVRNFATSWKRAPLPEESLPRSLECLVLLDAGCGAWTDRNGQVVLLEEVIVRMMECGRYRSLKKVFVQGFSGAKCQEADTASFEKAIAAGKLEGVTVQVGPNGPLPDGTIFSKVAEEWVLRRPN